MATEAKVKVMVDVEDAKRSMDDVNQRIEKSRALGANLASSVQNIARGAAAGIAMAGGLADKIAGGGLIAGLGGDLLGAGAHGLSAIAQALGLDTGKLGESGAEYRARARALETVRGLVGAGGDVSKEQIEKWVADYTTLYRPGEKNIGMVDEVERGEAAERVARGVNSIQAMNRLTDKLAELVVTLQQWSPFS